MIDYSLYLITDNPSRYRKPWLETIMAALDGGVTCVQYRDTENGPHVQFERIRALQDILKPRHIPLVVNNDAELARSVGAQGVHVGQGDMSPLEVRRIVGNGCEIGLSITCEDDLMRPDALQEVSAIGIGPIYDARKTKADASPTLGTERLAKIVRLAPPNFPNCAIGGITLENASIILRAGAQGLAIVSALSQSENPYESARTFSLLLDRCRL